MNNIYRSSYVYNNHKNENNHNLLNKIFVFFNWYNKLQIIFLEITFNSYKIAQNTKNENKIDNWIENINIKETSSSRQQYEFEKCYLSQTQYEKF